VWHVACMGERRDASYCVSVGKPAGRGPLERPRRRWQNAMKLDFQGMEWDVD
jgi:hypothetical protein